MVFNLIQAVRIHATAVLPTRFLENLRFAAMGMNAWRIRFVWRKDSAGQCIHNKHDRVGSNDEEYVFREEHTCYEQGVPFFGSKVN